MISHTNTHTYIHTAYAGANILIHFEIYIHTNSYVLTISLISKIYLAQYVYSDFGFQKLLTCETHTYTD